jgi:membrane fusion protein (multidrug efflux system)
MTRAGQTLTRRVEAESHPLPADGNRQVSGNRQPAGTAIGPGAGVTNPGKANPGAAFKAGGRAVEGLARVLEWGSREMNPNERLTWRRRSMRSRWIGSSLLLAAVLGIGIALAFWKMNSIEASDAGFASQPEPMESVAVATAQPIEHQPTTVAIGTVIALRSITLRNELAGTVRQAALDPGTVVEAGKVLVGLDVSVEEAELRALQAQESLAESLLARTQRASDSNAVSASELDRALSERDVARAQIARTQAIVEKKTLRAPFRARVGISDVHQGQYLEEGTLLTTLQGVDGAAYVDFSVAQQVAAGLHVADTVEVLPAGSSDAITARIAAIDARVDPSTRNAVVRARIEGLRTPSPGSSVRVRVPVGPRQEAVAIPLIALRKGPEGDHVYIITADKDGKPRAYARTVQSGPVVGGNIVIEQGLEAGEQVAASGSFKLREAVLVAVETASNSTAPGTPEPQQVSAAHSGVGGK